MNNNRIKEVRLSQHKTQKDLANLLGVSEQAIAYYEKALREPPLASWVKMANYLDVSVPYLQGINNYKSDKDIWKELEKYKVDSNKIPINNTTAPLIIELQNNSIKSAINNFKVLDTAFSKINPDYMMKNDRPVKGPYYDLILEKADNPEQIQSMVNALELYYSIYINAIIGHSSAKKDKKILDRALSEILDEPYEKIKKKIVPGKSYNYRQDSKLL